MEKMVSIIMGVYNCEKTLGESIESIINQSYTNWELIICDDGSCDRTYELAIEFSKRDHRIKLIKNAQNLGLAKTLNFCLEHSSGDYIMRHDGDDIMMLDRIEKQVNYMNFNQCDACGSGALLFDESGIWGQRQPTKIPDKRCMVLAAPFIHPTLIIKREVLLSVGGYSNNELTKKRLEDYDLWIKLFERNSTLHNIQESLIYFREDKNAYKRKKKMFRVVETFARLNACKRLNIPYVLRIMALKPLVLLILPSFILRKYHKRKAIIRIQGEFYG